MSKKVVAVLAIFAFLAVIDPVLAAKPDLDLPGEDGTYDVLGHKDLKLRVIVHKVKPGLAPAPTEVCNLPDNDSTAVVGLAGWHLPSTFDYSLNPGSAPVSIGSSGFATLTDSAFDVWTDAAGGAVDINRAGNTTKTRQSYDGVNMVTFGRTSPGALGVTYIWYNPSSGTVVELDTILNTKYAWEWSDPSLWETSPGTTCAFQNVYDAQDIMTHELGHWMGLDDEYTEEYVYNTMYGYGYRGQTSANTLAAGDIAAIRLLY